MFCKECGKGIPDDSVFCPECGAQIAAPPAAATPASPRPAPGGAAVGQGLNIGIIVASLIFPLVGVIMGAVYLCDQNAAKKKAGKVWLWVGIAAAALWIVNLAGSCAAY